FEDGEQTRDFVHVRDVVQANLRALETDRADWHALNIGSGAPTSVRYLAELIAASLDKSIEPELVGRYREGDIRHCYADVSRARDLLGYRPSITLEGGLPELIDWVSRQGAEDRTAQAI